MDREVIAIIPARGGSKGIPRKNVRIFNGMPLIEHATRIAMSAKKVSKVIVTSDDPEILEIATRSGAIPFKREPELASDVATLDVVIHDVVETLQASDAIIVTIQATCPLIKSSTIDRAVEAVQFNPKSTCFTVVENRHLTWVKKGEEFRENYLERVNRQDLEPFFTETGGVVACLASKVVNFKTRFVAPYQPICVTEIESIDIDTSADWAKAQIVSRQKRIAVFVTGNETIGLGHLYRQLALYDHFAMHEICFFCPEADSFIIKFLSSKFIAVKGFNYKSVNDILSDFRPDVIINDLLDGWVDLIEPQRATDAKIVIFETEVHEQNRDYDVVNALYPSKYFNDRIGPDWFILRPEFMSINPKIVTNEVTEILVTFGGVDPADQALRLYQILSGCEFKNVHRTIVLGKAYNGGLIDVESNEDFEIVHDTSQISKYMNRADIAITSKGRTIYELAKCGVPTLSISQNDREVRHSFGGVYFEDLGLYSDLSNEELKSSLLKLCSDVSKRRSMQLNNVAISFRGIENIIKLIEE